MTEQPINNLPDHLNDLIPYRCPKCGHTRRFATLRELRLHLQNVHSFQMGFIKPRPWVTQNEFSDTKQLFTCGTVPNGHVTNSYNEKREVSPLLKSFQEETEELEHQLQQAKQNEFRNKIFFMKRLIDNAKKPDYQKSSNSLLKDCEIKSSENQDFVTQSDHIVLSGRQQSGTFVLKSKPELNADVIEDDIERDFKEGLDVSNAIYKSHKLIKEMENIVENKCKVERELIQQLMEDIKINDEQHIQAGNIEQTKLHEERKRLLTETDILTRNADEINSNVKQEMSNREQTFDGLYNALEKYRDANKQTIHSKARGLQDSNESITRLQRDRDELIRETESILQKADNDSMQLRHTITMKEREIQIVNETLNDLRRKQHSMLEKIIKVYKSAEECRNLMKSAMGSKDTQLKLAIQHVQNMSTLQTRLVEQSNIFTNEADDRTALMQRLLHLKAGQVLDLLRQLEILKAEKQKREDSSVSMETKAELSQTDFKSLQVMVRRKEKELKTTQSELHDLKTFLKSAAKKEQVARKKLEYLIEKLITGAENTEVKLQEFKLESTNSSLSNITSSNNNNGAKQFDDSTGRIREGRCCQRRTSCSAFILPSATRHRYRHSGTSDSDIDEEPAAEHQAYNTLHSEKRNTVLQGQLIRRNGFRIRDYVRPRGSAKQDFCTKISHSNKSDIFGATRDSNSSEEYCSSILSNKLRNAKGLSSNNQNYKLPSSNSDLIHRLDRLDRDLIYRLGRLDYETKSIAESSMSECDDVAMLPEKHLTRDIIMKRHENNFARASKQGMPQKRTSITVGNSYAPGHDVKRKTRTKKKMLKILEFDTSFPKTYMSMVDIAMGKKDISNFSDKSANLRRSRSLSPSVKQYSTHRHSHKNLSLESSDTKKRGMHVVKANHSAVFEEYSSQVQESSVDSDENTIEVKGSTEDNTKEFSELMDVNGVFWNDDTLPDVSDLELDRVSPSGSEAIGAKSICLPANTSANRMVKVNVQNFGVGKEYKRIDQSLQLPSSTPFADTSNQLTNMSKSHHQSVDDKVSQRRSKNKKSEFNLSKKVTDFHIVPSHKLFRPIKSSLTHKSSISDKDISSGGNEVRKILIDSPKLPVISSSALNVLSSKLTTAQCDQLFNCLPSEETVSKTALLVQENARETLNEQIKRISYKYTLKRSKTMRGHDIENEVKAINDKYTERQNHIIDGHGKCVETMPKHAEHYAEIPRKLDENPFIFTESSQNGLTLSPPKYDVVQIVPQNCNRQQQCQSLPYFTASNLRHSVKEKGNALQSANLISNQAVLQLNLGCKKEHGLETVHLPEISKPEHLSELEPIISIQNNSKEDNIIRLSKYIESKENKVGHIPNNPQCQATELQYIPKLSTKNTPLTNTGLNVMSKHLKDLKCIPHHEVLKKLHRDLVSKMEFNADNYCNDVSKLPEDEQLKDASIFKNIKQGKEKEEHLCDKNATHMFVEKSELKSELMNNGNTIFLSNIQQEFNIENNLRSLRDQLENIHADTLHEDTLNLDAAPAKLDKTDDNGGMYKHEDINSTLYMLDDETNSMAHSEFADQIGDSYSAVLEDCTVQSHLDNNIDLDTDTESLTRDLFQHTRNIQDIIENDNNICCVAQQKPLWNTMSSASSQASIETLEIIPLAQREEVKLRRSALVCIFSYLNTATLCRVGQVCREWRIVCRSPKLWQRISLTNEKVSFKFLMQISKRCAQLRVLCFEDLRPRNKTSSESIDEYHASIICSLEPGLEQIVKRAESTLHTISIVNCGTLLSAKCLWVASCCCRMLRNVTYLSSFDLVNTEVMWALGSGCRTLKTLKIHPILPCANIEVFNTRCAQLIGKCFLEMETLSIGGPNVDVTALIYISKQCQQLKCLDVYHMDLVSRDIIANMCQSGLNCLKVIRFLFTPLEYKGISVLYEKCPHLELIFIQLREECLVKSDVKGRNKKDYREMIAKYHELQKDPSLSKILKLDIEQQMLMQEPREINIPAENLSFLGRWFKS